MNLHSRSKSSITSTILVLLAIVFIFGGFAAARLEAAPTAATAAAPTAAESKTIKDFSRFLGYAMGKRFGSQGMILDAEAFGAALKAGLNNEAEPFKAEDLGKIQADYSAYLDKLAAGENGDKIKENDAFLKAQAQKIGWHKTNSGIVYRIEKQGADPKPTAESTVKVHYVGSLIDGTVFNDSKKMGGPFDFKLDQVVAGWTEALQLIGAGGVIDMYLPPELGYGSRAQGEIPAYSILHFQIEVLEVK